MLILGISCYFHDSAACIIDNGNIIAACQEERFSRKKNDSDFPLKAIKFCLKKCNINLNKIDKIVFYENSEKKYKRILYSYKTFFPKSIPLIFKTFWGMPPDTVFYNGLWHVARVRLRNLFILPLSIFF